MSPAIKGRYFVTEKVAVRGGFGLNNTKVIKDYKSMVSGKSDGFSDVRRSDYTIAAGVERHFNATSSAISPYVGAEMSISCQSYSYNGLNYNASANTWMADYEYTARQKGNVYQFNLIAGAEYCFATDIYLGLEIGWGLMNTSYGDFRESETVNGLTKEFSTPGRNEAGVSARPNTGIRIGFFF